MFSSICCSWDLGSSFPKAAAQQKRVGDPSGTAVSQGARHTQLSWNWHVERESSTAH